MENPIGFWTRRKIWNKLFPLGSQQTSWCHNVIKFKIEFSATGSVATSSPVTMLFTTSDLPHCWKNTISLCDTCFTEPVKTNFYPYFRTFQTIRLYRSPRRFLRIFVSYNLLVAFWGIRSMIEYYDFRLTVYDRASRVSFLDILGTVVVSRRGKLQLARRYYQQKTRAAEQTKSSVIEWHAHSVKKEKDMSLRDDIIIIMFYGWRLYFIFVALK